MKHDWKRHKGGTVQFNFEQPDQDCKADFVEQVGADFRIERVRDVLLRRFLNTRSSSHPRTDQDLLQAVLEALRGSALLPRQGITVQVQSRWVILSGLLDTSFQRSSAADAVLALPGVRGLRNRVVLRPPASSSEIHAQLVHTFEHSRAFDARQLSVGVVGTRVTLHGSFSSEAERTAAQHLAWSVRGVTGVQNQTFVAG